MCYNSWVRRYYDSRPGSRRGSEPLCSDVWKSRVDDLLRAMEGRAMSLKDIAKMMKKNKAWSEIFTKNVLAAGEDGQVFYSRYSKVWKPVVGSGRGLVE